MVGWGTWSHPSELHTSVRPLAHGGANRFHRLAGSLACWFPSAKGVYSL